ncbi:hypothetical protein SC260_15070 [Legionella pneumophila serogroup 1]
MNECKHHKISPWLVAGIITGFMLGFSYFAIGVYIHTKNKAPQMNPANLHLDYDRAGTTR